MGTPSSAGLDGSGRRSPTPSGALERARGGGCGAESSERRGTSSRGRRARCRQCRRVEELLGSRRQDSLEDRIGTATELLGRLERLLAAAIGARDAVGERSAELERRMLVEADPNDVPAQLRACSRAEAELQAKLLAGGDSVTEAEVRRRSSGSPRRGEGRAGADRGRLGHEVEHAGGSRSPPRSARRSSASSSGWPAAPRRSARSTPSPRRSTPRRSSTSKSSRSSAATSSRRSRSWRA